MAAADWTEENQRVWHDFMRIRPNCEPSYSPLPYTTGKEYVYPKTEEPKGYEIRVRSRKKGEKRSSPPPDSDDGLPPTAAHAIGAANRSAMIDGELAKDVLPSSPPRLLRSREHNFLFDDSDDDDDDEIGPDDKDLSQIDSVELPPKKTRSGTRFAEWDAEEEVEEQDKSEEKNGERETTMIDIANADDSKFNENRCFRGKDREDLT